MLFAILALCSSGTSPCRGESCRHVPVARQAGGAKEVRAKSKGGTAKRGSLRFLPLCPYLLALSFYGAAKRTAHRAVATTSLRNWPTVVLATFPLCSLQSSDSRSAPAGSIDTPSPAGSGRCRPQSPVARCCSGNVVGTPSGSRRIRGQRSALSLPENAMDRRNETRS